MCAFDIHSQGYGDKSHTEICQLGAHLSQVLSLTNSNCFSTFMMDIMASLTSRINTSDVCFDRSSTPRLLELQEKDLQ